MYFYAQEIFIIHLLSIPKFILVLGSLYKTEHTKSIWLQPQITTFQKHFLH